MRVETPAVYEGQKATGSERGRKAETGTGPGQRRAQPASERRGKETQQGAHGLSFSYVNDD